MANDYYHRIMKTKSFKTSLLIMVMGLTVASLPVLARDQDDSQDEKHGYAYYLTSSKHWNGHHNDNDDDKWLRLFSKASEVKSVGFNGTIEIPSTLRANSGLLRVGNSQAQLIFDGRVQCTYEARLTKKYFNSMYSFVSCNNGLRPGEDLRVDSSVAIYLKDIKGTPSTIFASVKVLERFKKGIKLPQLEASKGQILRFDGELWVPSNYIPDGQSAGDVLLWDGSTWMASKLGAGAQGPQGPAGADGVQGPQGIQGPQGLQGPAGPQGPQGLIGPAGANGINGLNGAMGATGAQGPQGLQGLKGDKGDAGDPGLVSLTAGNGILGGTILGNGGTIAVNTGNAAGQIPVIDSTGKLPASIIPDSGAKVAFIKDIKPNGIHGGTCDPAKAWEQVRDLNSLSGDTSFVSLAANEVTLGAGTYIIEANAPAYLDGYHKAVLANAQTSEFILNGSNARSHNIAGGMESSHMEGQVVLTAPTRLVIKHRCSSLMNNAGFGAAVSFGVDEVYTQMKITKIK